jgi:hypothetical protein
MSYPARREHVKKARAKIDGRELADDCWKQFRLVGPHADNGRYYLLRIGTLHAL